MSKNGNSIEDIFNSCLYNTQQESHKTPAKSVTILVADDNKSMRQSVQDLLSLHNLDCLLSADGQETLDIMANTPCDILLLDLIMPNIDGFQVMKEVKVKYPNTDIIVTSGDATFKNATLAMRHGVKDFLHKPYMPDELINVITNLIEKRELKRQLDEMCRCIKTSEKHYRFFVDNSPDMIYMLDQQGYFTFINPRAIEILGYSQEEIIGQHYTSFIHPEDINKTQVFFNRCLKNMDAAQKFEFRIPFKTAESNIRILESRSIAVKLNTIEMSGNTSHKEFIGVYGVARDITEQKRLDKLLYFQLYHDVLTQLPNRIALQNSINSAIAQANYTSHKVAIMFLDMDRFKVVNDSLGHLAGDKLLQKISTRLKSCIRDIDTLARVGGDEFILMLVDIISRDDVIILVNKITQALTPPFIVEGNEVYVTFSMGTAIYPEDASNSETLIKYADMAMYNIKGKGKNGHEFFSDHIKALFQHHLSIENGIRKALQENQFEIYFQPQYHLETKKISAVEALIRWNHPEKGLVSPNHFIPLSEEIGLINSIGQWVLDTACHTYQQWIKDHPILSPITLAVNISTFQIESADFVDFVLATLKKYHLKGEQLELEITENALMQDMKLAVEKLKQLAKHGVRIAVDDFGMGYSSLSYLQTLPINNLKIDRSFISTIQSKKDKNSIISAIVAMAKELGIDIVVEGVENKIQMDYVQAIDCPIIQGYWFSPPLPAEQIKNLALQQFNEIS